MKLTSKGKYSVRAVLDLAVNQDGRPVRLRDISDRQGISLHYLEQLFRRLRTNNVVQSVRGPGGGYVLARPETQIMVKDILEGAGETTTYANKTQNYSTAEEQVTAGFFGTDLTIPVQNVIANTSLASLVERVKTNASNDSPSV